MLRRVSPLEVVEGWRQKCSSVSGQSNDALVAVLKKGFDAIATVLEPTATQADFDRALASLDLERINSLQYDGRRDVTVRELTYGMTESLHLFLRELAMMGWSPAFHGRARAVQMKRERMEAPPRQPAMGDQRPPRDQRSFEDERLARRDEGRQSLPATEPMEESRLHGDDVKFESLDDLEEPMPPPPPPRRLGALAYGYDPEDEVEDDRQTVRTEAAGRAPHNHSFHRARSMPTATGRASGALGERGGGEVQDGRVGKRKPGRKPGRKGTLGCTLCEWHEGNTPGTVIRHLRMHHGATPVTAGLYFRCECGFVSRTNNHYLKCKPSSYAIVKDADETFRPNWNDKRPPERNFAAARLQREEQGRETEMEENDQKY